MLEKIKTISIVLLIYNSLSGQSFPEYTPLEFANMATEWVHTCSDSTIAGYQDWEFKTVVKFTGTNHMAYRPIEERRPLLYDDDLISISDIIWDGDHGGALIERIDLETGERLWKSTWDLRELPHREVIVESYIEDAELVLATAEVFTPDHHLIHGILTFAHRNVAAGLNIRRYALNSGDLIEHIQTDTLAQDYLFMNINESRRTVVKKLEGDFLGVYKYFDYSKLQIDTINFEGVKVNPSDTIHSLINRDPDKVYVLSHKSKFAITEDGIVKIDLLAPYFQGDSTSITTLSYYNNDRELLWSHRYESVDTTQDAFMTVMSQSDNKVFIRTHNINGNKDYGLLGVTKDGIVNNIRFLDHTSTPYLTEIDERGEAFLMFNVNGTIADRKIHIYKTDENSLIKYDSLELVHDTIMTVLASATPYDDSHYLLEFFHGKTGPYHKEWMKVESSEFIKKTTSTDDYTRAKLDRFTIYPNPVKSTITIENATTGLLELKNTSGQLMSRTYIEEEGDRSIDLSTYPPGIYFITLQSEGNPIQTSKFLKL
jgi:hypothetical protein